MPNVRHERVRELLKRALGEAVRREFNVDEVGLITVNDVDLAGDLKSAVVYVSILGSASQQKHALTILEQHRIRIQAMMAKSVVLKYTPTLRFVADDSILRGNRVLQILDELEKTVPPAAGVEPIRGAGDK